MPARNETVDPVEPVEIEGEDGEGTTDDEVVEDAAKPAAGHTIKGKTLIVDGASEFDGVNTPTLRSWLRYWENEDRCKDNPAITEERPRAEHIRLLREELEARGKAA